MYFAISNIDKPVKCWTHQYPYKRIFLNENTFKFYLIFYVNSLQEKQVLSIVEPYLRLKESMLIASL